MLSTLHTHQATLGGATTTLQTSYTYDHRERLIDTRRQVNNDTEFIESRQGYNQVGQLVSRSLHGNLSGSSFLSTQSLHYNERGWLSKQSASLFTQELRYANPASGITPQYNGNIAEQRWGYSSSTPESFRYSYDKLGRLLDGQSISSAMREELSYDKMGNIQSLQRDGATAITYHYTGNRLNSVSGGLSGSYSYDAIGNALTDRSGFTYTYNHLNQPSTISKTGVSISYSYDALGNKRKSIGAIGAGITRDYLPGGIEYTNGTLERIATAEGYITFSGSTPVYQYYLRDHLGNVRTVFSASGGTATTIQQQDYYPFGLRKALAGSGVNAYLYNGKELQGELGQYDYGARFYDPVIGRWNVVDPLAEKYYSYSPYSYAANNPIRLVDSDGRQIHDPNFSRGFLTGMWNTVQATGSFIKNTYQTRGQNIVDGARSVKDFAVQAYEDPSGTWDGVVEGSKQAYYQKVIEHGSVSGAVGDMAGQITAAMAMGIATDKGLSQAGRMLKVADEIGDLGKAGAAANEGYKTLSQLGLKDGMRVSSSRALELGEQFLGKGYKELVPGSGRYVSADGTRVFRMGVSDITGAHGGGPHVNFETLIPNPAKAGKMMVDQNFHIYLTN